MPTITRTKGSFIQMTKKTLYICEKPDQGRIIAKALGGGTPNKGFMEGSDWIVSWGFGHLMTIFMPEDYDPDLKKWAWDSLPILPKEYKFKVLEGYAGSQFHTIRKLSHRAREIIIATDADREGEMIAYEIINAIGWRGPLRRLWLSDLTLPAVQRALSSLLPAEKTRPLYEAALARTIADWTVGMNMTRGLTLKLRDLGLHGISTPMSVGRVQTPVLALIVEREEKITKFRSTTYYEIVAQVETADGQTIVMRHARPEKDRILSIDEAKRIAENIQGAVGPLSVSVKPGNTAPPLPLHLNSLQQECNSRFSWSADHALSVAQSLYEKHNLLTYPRTDCRHLPSEHAKSIPQIHKNIANHSDFLGIAKLLEADPPKARAEVYNDSKVTAHHAIIPTLKPYSSSGLTDDERKLYLLVVAFWAAAHMRDAKWLATSISMDANSTPLKATGKQFLDRGWMDALSIFGESDEEDPRKGEDQQKLPKIADGTQGRVTSAKPDEKKTTPPKRFTEKTLLQAMENIASHIEDKEAKKILRETSGIGTPATRASIIETLKKRNYIKANKRNLVPTDLGMLVIKSLRNIAPDYADPVMTARWEDVLETVATGKNPNLKDKFVDGIRRLVQRDVSLVKEAKPSSEISEIISSLSKSTRPTNRSDNRPLAKQGGAKGRRPDISKGMELDVPYEKKDEAKALGAIWSPDKRKWICPPGSDVTAFRKAGFLK